MVERNISGRGIKDQRLLRVMGTLPRHLFVPQELRFSAYEDRPLPIGAGQTISQPYIVAFMTEALETVPPSWTINGVRADGGFFDQKFLHFLEQRRLQYVVVVRRKDTIQRHFYSPHD